MIEPSTVLVLGAGASKPYGFPLGNELKTEILAHLNNPEANELVKCGFDDGVVAEFRGALRDAIHETIDDFLDSRPTYRRIGSFAIAQSILRHEIDAQLLPRGNWYPYLFGAIDFRNSEQPSPIAAVVTFNYDRSLERYLARTIDASFEGSVRELARQKLRTIPIIHVHGKLGAYPEVPYGQADIVANLPKAAESVRITSDIELDKSLEYERAREAIGQAKNVVFLGFGYHERSLQRLKIDSIRGKRIYGSAFGVDPTTRDRITRTFNGSIELGDGVQEIGNYFYNLKMVSAEQ